jgi:hypothetical protein
MLKFYFDTDTNMTLVARLFLFTRCCHTLGIEMVRRSSSSGLIMALTALLLQLAFGVAGGSMLVSSDATRGTRPGPLSELSALLPGADILCHTNADDAGRPAPQAPGKHHHGDCAICPICVATAQTATMLAMLPAVPQRLPVAVRLAALQPPAAAPPGTSRTSVQPRAPPSLT